MIFFVRLTPKVVDSSSCFPIFSIFFALFPPFFALS